MVRKKLSKSLNSNSNTFAAMKPWNEKLFEKYGSKYDQEVFTQGTLGAAFLLISCIEDNTVFKPTPHM